MFNHFVLRQPPIMQTTTSLSVVVKGVGEPRLQTHDPSDRPGVRASGVWQPWTSQRPEAEQRRAGGCEAASLLERATAGVSALNVQFDARALRTKPAEAGETASSFMTRVAYQNENESTLAPRRRWETNTLGDVR